MKKSTELEQIVFDGRLINKGWRYYYCPFECGDPRYPPPKWKTKKGFQGHLKKCPKNPSVIKKKKEKNKEILPYFAKMVHKYSIGNILYYIKETVIKPTHEYHYGGIIAGVKYSRRVRVRNEAVLKYTVKEITVKNISFRYPESEEFNKEKLKNFIIYNEINVNSLFANKEECEESANKKQKDHEEYLDLCSRCR